MKFPAHLHRTASSNLGFFRFTWMILSALGLMLVSKAEGARLLAWDFFGENTLATSTAEVADTNLDSSKDLTRGSTAAASAGANSFRTVGFLNNGISVTNTDYFQFVISAADGFKVSLATLDARFAGTASFRAAPGVSGQFAYSLDGTTFTLIGSPFLMTADAAMPQINLSGIADLQNVQGGTTVTFRYYASGQTTTGGWGFQSTAAGLYGLDIGGEVAVGGPVVDTNSYWDANGATAGAGGSAPTGIWGTDAFWSNSATGEATTSAWVAGGDAVFSSGSDATGSFTVGVSGTQSLGSIKFEEGIVLLSGGSIELSDASPLVNVAATAAEIDSDILGTHGLVKSGTGKLTLAGAKTFAGVVSIASGTLQIAADSSLGNADNDISNNGTLATTASFSLPATRSVTGGGSLAPTAGTTLEVLGNVAMTALTIGGEGTVDLKGASPSIGALSFTAAGKLSGTNVTVSGLSTGAAFTGTATVENDLSLGTSNLTATVAHASATLTLSGALTLLPTGVSLTKSGPGTLRLLGNNANLNRLSIGAAGTSGGKVVVNNKDSLGKQQTFFNAGTIESLSDLTGANEIFTGLSMGGREAAPVVLMGEPMTFAGSSGFFTGGSTVEIRLNVLNHTSLTGGLTTTVSSGAVTGFAIGGTGTLTLSGVMMNFAADLKLKDSAILEVDTSDIGLMSAPAKMMTLDAGTTLVLGKAGTTRLITAYDGLNGAANSVLKFDIGGTVRGNEYDALILAKPVSTAASPITFAGKIDVDVLGGFELALGQSFDLLDWDSSITPDFTGIDFSLLPTLPAGLEWKTTNFPVNGTISVVTTSGADFAISPQPQSLTKFVGQEATFTVGVSGGTGPFTYQWKKGETLLGGPTPDAFYTLPAVTSADAGGYSVDITNASGTQSSATAILTVVVPVSIDQPPVSKTIVVGGNATFSVSVNPLSTGPLTYSWRKNSEPILNSNASSYAVSAAQLTDNGSVYDVVVTGPGAGNSVTSTPATLTVKIPGPIEITGNQTYTENFDVVGTVGTVYPNGWFGNDTDLTPGLSALLVGNGGANSGRIYNFGSTGTGSGDRAIGSVASGSFLGSFGVSFTNLTGVTLEGSNVQIGFRSELWRSGSDAAVESWVFEWKLGGDPASNEGYVRSSAFDITELNPGLTDNVAKDGNSEGNYAVLPASVFTALSGWEPGQILHIRWRDANDPGNDAGMAIDDFTLTTVNVPPPPVPRYWDINATAAGAGGAMPAGSWTGTFWGSLADGTSATEAWLPGADAIFSAGADATGAFTVDITGIQDVGALIFEEGTVTLAGGTLHFNDTQPTINVLAGSATVSSVLTSEVGLLKRGAGMLTLSGSNTFTGNVLIAAGSLEISSTAQLGAVENDLILSSGTLMVSDSLTLEASRALSGGGTLAVPEGEVLTLNGPVSLSSLTLTGAGGINLQTATTTLGSLTMQSPVTLAGNALALTALTVSHGAGSSVIPNDLDLGSSVASVTVAPDAVLQLDGDLTLAGTGSNRLVKSGAGTLVLTGMNSAMNKLAIGSQGAVTTNGGRVIFSNKDALGFSSVFFNYGTLEALEPMTGDSSLALGLSVAGRAGGETTLTGAAMTFQQGLDLYADAGPNVDIQLTVENHTTVQGGISVNSTSTARVTGFAVAGTGTFTFEGAVPQLSIPLKILQGVSFELDTDFNTAGSTAVPVISISDGASFAVGKTGGIRLVTLYGGLSTATESEIKFDLAGTNRGGIEGGYDALVLGKTEGGQTGTVAVHGKVKASLVGGFTPLLGQVFDLLDWDATVVPDFTGLTFDLPALGETLAWSTASFTTDGTIRIVENRIDITDPPDSLQVNPGVQVTFSVTAVGPGVLTYQWFKGIQPIDGATSSTYTIASAAESDEGSYTVVVTSGSLTATSNPAVLTVNTPVSSVLASRTPATSPLYVGDSVKFQVTSLGTGTLVYQWYKGETLIEGATGSTYTINALALTDAADYHVTVSNGGPPVASNDVPLTVDVTAPAFTMQPTPDKLLLGVGQMMTLQVTASGKPPLKFQWKKDGKSIGGATAAIYRVPAVTAVMGGTYTCEVSNLIGKVTQKVTSDPALIGVIQTAPVVLTLAKDATAVMKVTVSGPSALSFAWKKDGVAFLPETLPTAKYILTADKKALTVKTLAVEDFGTYTILASMSGIELTGGTHVVSVFTEKPTSPATVAMPRGIVGGSYAYDMPVTPMTPPTNAPSAYAAKGLPPGLKMDPKTGRISGKPTKASTTVPDKPYTVTMTASNKAGSAITVGTLYVDAFPDKLAGVYAAMIAPNAGLNATLGGRLDLTVTATGTYSGSVTLGTVKYAIKGAIDVDAEGLMAPSVKLAIPRKGNPVPLPLDLDLDLPLNDAPVIADKDRLLTGTIDDEVDTAVISGWRYKWDAKKGPKAEGYDKFYTFGIGLPDGDPLIGDDTVPQGAGYGSFKIGLDGKLKIAGKSADGETLTCASFVGPAGEVFVFQTLYTPVKGSIIGVPKITLATSNTFAGTLTWIRPPNTAKSARTYKDGFGPIRVTVSGGAYTVPDVTLGKVAFNLAVDSDIDVEFTEGGINLASPARADIQVNIGLKNKVTLIGTANPSLTAVKSINPATGAFTGSFTLLDDNLLTPTAAKLKRVVTFQGLIIPEGDSYVGVGYFLLPQRPSAGPPATTVTTSPILSGQVSLLPVSSP